jgi:outer membrane biosynthesis protein TonB
MHISDFLDSLSSSAPGKDDDSVNHAGLNGIGMPSCIHCPDPSYSDFPRAGRVQGVAVFQVVISADGTAERLYPMKLIGYGLDENAYNTIKQWRFKPARDKSGVAVPCIVPIEVTFRLY